MKTLATIKESNGTMVAYTAKPIRQYTRYEYRATIKMLSCLADANNGVALFDNYNHSGFVYVHGKMRGDNRAEWKTYCKIHEHVHYARIAYKAYKSLGLLELARKSYEDVKGAAK